MRLIRSIAGRRKLFGADICGEYPVSPVEVYNRRHRLAVRRNARANQMLLEAIRGVDRRSLPLSSWGGGSVGASRIWKVTTPDIDSSRTSIETLKGLSQKWGSPFHFVIASCKYVW